MKGDVKIKIVFFGTSEFSIGVLDALKERQIIPDLIITAPDRPKGRGLKLTPPPVKAWAQKHNIPFLQPEVLNDSFRSTLYDLRATLFIVASYGKIIPKIILDIPKFGTLNVHPSLLPRLRGASPIQTAILEEDETGVTIMQVDEKMDHGPIVAQEKIPISPWPLKASVLENKLAKEGGILLSKTIPLWVNKRIKAIPQEHEKATFTKKFTKEDGLINLSDDPTKNFRKIQAFDLWPKTYMFVEKQEKIVRIVITEAEMIGSNLNIKRVIPEGKKEMDYKNFLQE